MEGRHHLGTAIGSRSFVTQYMQEKVDYWVSCVQKLSKIARVQPHVAYCAFTNGLIGTWTYGTAQAQHRASKHLLVLE